jgi:hypothetical protein
MESARNSQLITGCSLLNFHDTRNGVALTNQDQDS